jgi:hypothetical protein
VILLGTEGEKFEGTGVGEAGLETGKSAIGASGMEKGRTGEGAVESGVDA